MKKVVFDTNVLIAALRSRQGASFLLLSLLGKQKFLSCVSVALVLEYESVLKRPGNAPGLSDEDIEAILNYVCLVSQHQRIHFLWRPFLKDAKDDMVLELAVAAECTHILTFNRRDFKGCEQFNLTTRTPVEFLREIGELK